MSKLELITDPQHIVFEGCDSVVMAPEDFENILAELAAAIEQRDKALSMLADLYGRHHMSCDSMYEGKKCNCSIGLFLQECGK
tara:strand:- start:504 stop:752 length:249 start_codon:yes stop_codon:yes gene_type:complete